MPTQTRPHRSALALLLVGALVTAASPITEARSTTSSLASAIAQVPAAAAIRAGSAAPAHVDDDPDDVRRVVSPVLAPAAAQPDWTSRPTPTIPQPKPKAQSTASESDDATATGGGTAYRGRNRVWIPALGIDRSISFFSCSSSAYPGDRVYRWGCAGGNNVYLFGHAHSVFKPLHDAYVRGRLKKGMKLVYADGDGRISTYRVAWWKVTTPDKGEFAYAAQSRPSVTLQTCVGAKSQFRLIVRLTKVG